METRLDNLRLYFPAEVTGAYVAIQGLLASNGVEKAEWTYFMFFIALVLAVINVAIYFRFYNISNVFTHAILAFGFLIWVANIDIERFKDLELVGRYVKIGAPTLLVIYT